MVPRVRHRIFEVLAGALLLLDLAEHGATQGITLIDFGWGEESYKYRYCTGLGEVVTGVMTSRDRGRVAA